jgi:hypothetical protein
MIIVIPATDKKDPEVSLENSSLKKLKELFP